MSVVSLYPPSGRADTLREQLMEMRDDMLDRMRRRGAVEPAHLPMLAGIEAVANLTVAAEDGEERQNFSLDRHGRPFKSMLPQRERRLH